MLYLQIIVTKPLIVTIVTLNCNYIKNNRDTTTGKYVSWTDHEVETGLCLKKKQYDIEQHFNLL